MNIIKTTPFEGKKPGTSGLRKTVTIFTQPNYLEICPSDFRLRPRTARRSSDRRGRRALL